MGHRTARRYVVSLIALVVVVWFLVRQQIGWMLPEADWLGQLSSAYSLDDKQSPDGDDPLDREAPDSESAALPLPESPLPESPDESTDSDGNVPSVQARALILDPGFLSLVGSNFRQRSQTVAFLWLLIAAACVATGRRQRREAGGRWLRLVAVSLAVAALWSLPLVAWVALADVFPGAGLVEPEVLGLAMIVGFLACACLQAPSNAQRSVEPLPLCDDPQVLAELAELAGEMGVVCPRVRVHRAVDESQTARALVGGLAPPSLLVSRDLLQRFQPDERRFVLAHELAHIANRSQWWGLLAWTLPLTMGVLAGMIASIWFAVPFAAALVVGLRRVVSRRFELDCDRRAARMVGLDAALRGLAKLHALSPISDRGWLSVLAFATATHPPRDARLAAVYAAAPPEDRPDAPFEPERVLWALRLAWACFAAWSVVVCGALWLETRAIAPVSSRLALAALAFLPQSLMLLTQWRRLAINRRRLYGAFAWRGLWRTRHSRVAVLLLLVVFVQFGFTHVEDFLSSDSDLLGPITWAAGPLLALLLLPITVWARPVAGNKRVARLTQEINAALARGEYGEIVRLADADPDLVRLEPILRYNAAIAAAATGDRPRSIRELESLRADRPELPLSWLILSCLYLDEDQPQHALDLAIGVSPKLSPRDPAAHGLAAWALRRLGRPDDAEAASRHVRSISPGDGGVLALAALLALDRGDVAEADRLLAEADAAAPGHASVHLARVERALADGGDADVEQSLAAARNAVGENPLMLLDRELERLETRVADRQRESANRLHESEAPCPLEV